MRLIDADALKAEIQRRRKRYKTLTGVDMAMLVDDAPTVGSWISVKDRLPDSMANKVLVWLEHEDSVGYIGFGHYEKFNGAETWYDLEHAEPFARHGYYVTRWMPLPEPPKEDNDGRV